jgi:sulfite exporter TauE/SafE
MQSYWELPLYLLSGLLGSGHCLGMCGGFVIAIGLHDRSVTKSLLKQFAYSMGRCFTYGSLGAILGAIGKRVVQEFEFIGNVGGAIAVAAGVIIIYLSIATLTGFSLTMQLRKCWSTTPAKSSCSSASLFSPVFKRGAAGITGAFLAGIATGFLPCGLLYGMLSIAAASQSVTRGAAVMLIFGLGTSPALMALGIAGRSITIRWRAMLYKASAISLLVAGAITCIRGGYALQSLASGNRAPVCPLCANK